MLDLKKRVTRGEANAIFAGKKAEAYGLFEILTKQAKGFEALFSFADNDARDAVVLLIAENYKTWLNFRLLPFKNIKIDK